MPNYRFEYNGKVDYLDAIELDELGQVCLEAIDNESLCYYLIIRTALGQASILEYGPIVLDSPLVADNTSIEFQRVEFNDNKIKKIIRLFLAPRNRGRNKIEQVRQLPLEEALGYGVNLLDYIKNFGETSNY